MIAKINTAAFSGIETIPVMVEAQVAAGMPRFNIVGLADKSVAESKERIFAAFAAMGLYLPPKKITVNLAPADLIKEGSHFDLPIAVALLTALNILPMEEIFNYVILGELSLDGGISRVSGVLPAAIGAAIHNQGLICPKANGAEAMWSGNEAILAPASLLELINHFKGIQILTAPERTMRESEISQLDMADIAGQQNAKKALEIAASGGHHLLMCGSPGAGKSMLASRLPTILPKLSVKQALEVSMIASIAGLIPEDGISIARPFRAPHHTSSQIAMTGGGAKALPGEVSLAHNGVLFLDEFPEFSRSTLEVLRQPLETGEISIARANKHVTYPARFQLVAAMNPCKCGHFGNPAMQCHKAPQCAIDYQSKISGPIFDRIDIHLDVPPIKPWEMSEQVSSEETSAQIRQRVERATQIQFTRYTKLFGESANFSNAHLQGAGLKTICELSSECAAFLAESAEKTGLSARGYSRVLKVARTIADLEEAEKINKSHLAQALSYRRISPHKN